MVFVALYTRAIPRPIFIVASVMMNGGIVVNAATAPLKSPRHAPSRIASKIAAPEGNPR